MSLRAAAAALNVSPATAHRWWHRWLDAGTCERRTLACLSERSSRPHQSPRMLCAQAQERICEVREHTGWGPRLIAGVTGHPHSTVHKVLRRHSCSRIPKPPRGEICRYEWDCPGDLLHMDTKRYGCFERPGHAVTGVRDKTAAEKRRGVGYEFAHSIVDDHSRLAYSELHPDERAETVSGFVERGLAFFERHGVTAQRLMTDNAWCYTHSNALRELLARRQVKHLLIKPHRPQTNGKVERFQQTMAREWAYGLVYRSSDDRRRALPHWISYYNERRPHSGIGDRPPISRVHNVRG
jgi:Integrase core domain/leucine-zipper of insertion element IS481